jgi:hypothetical protein
VGLFYLGDSPGSRLSEGIARHSILGVRRPALVPGAIKQL